MKGRQRHLEIDGIVVGGRLDDIIFKYGFLKLN